MLDGTFLAARGGGEPQRLELLTPHGGTALLIGKGLGAPGTLLLDCAHATLCRSLHLSRGLLALRLSITGRTQRRRLGALGLPHELVLTPAARGQIGRELLHVLLRGRARLALLLDELWHERNSFLLCTQCRLAQIEACPALLGPWRRAEEFQGVAQVVERGVRAASAARATLGGLGCTGVVSVREACGTESQPRGALSINERALARLVVPWPRPLLRLRPALARLPAHGPSAPRNRASR